MRITLFPKSTTTDDIPPLVQHGDLITYRGLTYDLSPIKDGDIYESSEPFVGGITRINGELVVSLHYGYSMETSENNQPANWDAYTFTVTEGKCPCPIIRKPVRNPKLSETCIGGLNVIDQN